ncbi:MAG: hypothetical protein QOK13_491 [Gaiellaceae bacterium]|nr:hypothetical protein [Gaiellaceae bacterium]
MNFLRRSYPALRALCQRPSMAVSGQDINPTLLSDSGRRAECLPAFRVLLDSAARPSGPRALGRLLVVAVAALAAAATAADASPAARRLQSPSTSEIARAGTITDTTLTPAGAERVARTASWGGVYTTPSGETVKVYASNTYPQDPAVGQRWADFLATLVHGPELGTITAYLAPLTEVQGLCGAQALACYSPRDSLLVAPGDDPYADTSAEAVVTHEYGHHVANNRQNPPWAAVDWGAKRWASYMQVCAKTKQGTFSPGAETLPAYRVNPGEGWAESYRVLNQRKAGLIESPWEIVARALYPDDGALSRLEQDVVTPWTAPTAESRSGSVSQQTRIRSYTVATPLDGTLKVSLRGPRTAKLTLDLFSGTTRIGHAVKTANATSTSTSLTICGQRSVGIRLTRTAGAGAFALAISKP